MALKGICVIELAGLAPAPFCGMILADFGASVIRIDKQVHGGMDIDCLGNGKRSLLLDLKKNGGIEILKTISKRADVLIDPYRPGVMEKLGAGPKILMNENRKLIYASLSGFGENLQKWSQRAGHDINFLGLSGIFPKISGNEGAPMPPANFAADFAGGGLMCALGIMMALFERSKSNMGQYLDANMTAGCAYAGSWFFRSKELGLWDGPRGTNMLDGGTHFYCCYETKDSKFMTVGAIEPKFYKLFIEGIGLSIDECPHFTSDTKAAKAQIQQVFKKHTQQHWIEVFQDIDACVTPLLVVEQAAQLNKEGYCYDANNNLSPKPAPVLSRTPAVTNAAKPKIEPGEHSIEILKEMGFSKSAIDSFIKNSVVLNQSKL